MGKLTTVQKNIIKSLFDYNVKHGLSSVIEFVDELPLEAEEISQPDDYNGLRCMSYGMQIDHRCDSACAITKQTRWKRDSNGRENRAAGREWYVYKIQIIDDEASFKKIQDNIEWDSCLMCK